jgi:hypothetical protein
MVFLGYNFMLLSQHQMRIKISIPLTLILSHNGARKKINKRMK